ncbi:MAG: hypothetical protein HYS05_15470 [Acidobacteria bacterium]|nr:hypothetical protein [Acidobacteriota bacterium]
MPHVACYDPAVVSDYRVRKRDREILIVWEIGLETRAQIAARLNTTPSVVAQVIARNRAEHGITLRRPRTRIR